MISSWAHRFGLRFARGRARAVVLLVGVAGVLALVPGAAGAARASGSETITTTLVFPYDQLPSNSGPAGTFSGTFSASGTVSDSGTVTAQVLVGAVRSPVAATQQTVRTYSGSNGTLTLRCNERFSPPGQDITNPNGISLAGSCVVLDATGAYAGLRGSGRFITESSTTTFGATAITIQDVLTL
jgi:hypothetical protein